MAALLEIDDIETFVSFRGAVRAMDKTFLALAQELSQPDPAGHHVSSRPMSPALFDALF